MKSLPLCPVENNWENNHQNKFIYVSYICSAFESYSVILELNVLLFNRLSQHCISVVSRV